MGVDVLLWVDFYYLRVATSMRFKPKLRIAFCLFVLAVLGAVVVANVADYRRSTSALARIHARVAQMKRLSPQQLEALGDYARTFSKDQFFVFQNETIPRELSFLNPQTVTVDANNGVVSMRLDFSMRADHTDMCGLFITIYSSPTNQCIRLKCIQDGRRDSNTTLWYRNPRLAKELSPDQRVVTIRFNGREWIVLPDEIRVIQRADESGCNDELLGSEPLSLVDRQSLKIFVEAIPSYDRGKHFSPSDVRNAQYLSVNFSPDGLKDENDINACNAWVESLAPLLDGISRLGPKKHPIIYEQVISTLNVSSQGPVVVLTNQQFWNKQHRSLTGPWWCLWRYLLKTSPIF